MHKSNNSSNRAQFKREQIHPFINSTLVAPLQYLVDQTRLNRCKQVRVLLIPAITTSVLILAPILLVPVSAGISIALAVTLLATIIGFPLGVITGLHIDMLCTNLLHSLRNIIK